MYPYLGYNYKQEEIVLDVFKVVFTKQAKRDLLKIPLHVVRKIQGCVDDIENAGLSEVRKVSGYHDELLKGKRAGQRSVRLSKAYRAIYVIGQDSNIEIVKVLEVNKHDY